MDIPLTIADTQKGLLAKKYTAVDLVDAYLARIKKFDPEINSFITVSDEVAYSQAKHADKTLSELGEKAFVTCPLLGSCVAYKDLYLTKGIRTTAGSIVLESYVPPYSATVVEKIERAGAICIGKTNCDAWAHGASGENSDFGSTKNPWNKKYVPGGSSSGSAAAVVSNFSLFATGTDTGGSTRQPANFCGIVGLKPTYGTVSRFGVVSMGSSLDAMGTLAHSVNDIERVFQIMKGEDGHDSTVKNFQTPNSNFQTKRLKVGLPMEYFIRGIDKEVEKKIIEASEVFKKSGVEIVDISLPHTKYVISVYYIVMSAEVSSNLGRYDGIRYGNVRDVFGDEAKRRIMLGTYVLSAGYYDAYYLKAMKVRSRLIEDFDKAFEKVDAILTPVFPTPPFKLGERVSDPLKMYLGDVFTVSANLAGVPGLAIPNGLSKAGLPLGFQLMGPRFSERTLFELGKIYERATDWKPKTASL